MSWLKSAESCVQSWNSSNLICIFFDLFCQKNSTPQAQKVGSRMPCYCLQRLYTVISRRAYVGAGLLHRTETEARLLELRTRALPFLPQPIPQGAVCFFLLFHFFMWSRQCGCLTACYWSLFLTCECVDDPKAWTWKRIKKWMTLSWDCSSIVKRVVIRSCSSMAEETRQNRRIERVLPAGSLFGFMASYDQSYRGIDSDSAK